jgi:hypothetical protein|tara:strand:- start:473 stop:613 length:141 start_codon:yes stop_codon:yes gene_type:complete
MDKRYKHLNGHEVLLCLGQIAAQIALNAGNYLAKPARHQAAPINAS